MIRITSGVFKGRGLATPGGERTRPTQSKLRQALFNSIQAYVTDAKVLDLFAGSGALGFEALSRGAASVVFVESSSSVCRLIRKNAETLGVVDRVRILCQPWEKGIEDLCREGPFDLVFADPPYEGNWETRLLVEIPWTKLLGGDGLFCLESGVQKSKAGDLPESVNHLQRIREKDYGDSRLSTFKLQST